VKGKHRVGTSPVIEVELFGGPFDGLTRFQNFPLPSVMPAPMPIEGTYVIDQELDSGRVRYTYRQENR
jgi:hypothetical protein